MRIWTLSIDGNIATARQVEGLAKNMQRQRGGPNKCSIEAIRPVMPPNTQQASNNTFVTWQSILPPEALGTVVCKQGVLVPPWPDVVISCRPEVAALALSIKAASGGKTKLVHIQNPNIAGIYDFDLSDFNVIVPQKQENLRLENTEISHRAISDLTPRAFVTLRREAQQRVGKAVHPAVAVLVGGSDDNTTLKPRDFHILAADIRKLSAKYASVFVVTSRRTGNDGVAILQEVAAGRTNIFIDNPRLSYMQTLALADAIVFTGESLSMGSEAMAPGKPCSVYSFRGALRDHPLFKRGIWQSEISKDRLREFPYLASPTRLTDELPILARRVLKRLDA